MTNSLSPRRLNVGPVKATKSYGALADALRERILTGDFTEGAPLPSERDIVGETGLGRGSVREALRVLEVEGLIRTKSGRYGGAFAARPDESGLTRFVSLFVRGRRVGNCALSRRDPRSNRVWPFLRRKTARPTMPGARGGVLGPGSDVRRGGLRPVEPGLALLRRQRQSQQTLIAFLTSIASAIARESDAHAKASRVPCSRKSAAP